MTIDDFPAWSFWMRDYAADHWVIFVVEKRREENSMVVCRVLATAVPLPTVQGTLAPGSEFTFKAKSEFAKLCQRLA